MPAKTKNDFQANLALLEAAYNRAAARVAEIAVELVELERSGMVDASEWWKGGKYLYLCHRSDGSAGRKREYIGCDPEEVAAARARVDRYKLHTKLRRERAKLEDRIRSCRTSVDHALWQISSVQRELWGEK